MCSSCRWCPRQFPTPWRFPWAHLLLEGNLLKEEGRLLCQIGLASSSGFGSILQQPVVMSSKKGHSERTTMQLSDARGPDAHSLPIL